MTLEDKVFDRILGNEQLQLYKQQNAEILTRCGGRIPTENEDLDIENQNSQNMSKERKLTKGKSSKRSKSKRKSKMSNKSASRLSKKSVSRATNKSASRATDKSAPRPESGLSSAVSLRSTKNK